MSIYVICPKCKTEYSTKHKKCPRCGATKPQFEKATCRVQVCYKYRKVRKTFTGLDVETMRKIELELKKRLMSGDIIDEKPSLSFDEFAYLYFEREQREKSKSKRSLEREKELHRKYIKPCVGNIPIDKMKDKNIREIKIMMQEKGLSPRTIQYALHVVRHIMNVAINEGYATVNPIKSIKIPKKDNKRIRWLTREEADRLLAELKGRTQRVYEIALVSLHTGMRLSEVLNLRWEDVDLKNGIIHIKDPKNKENRVAYMTQEIKDLLSRKQKEKKCKTNLVFHTKNCNKYTSVDIAHTFKKIIDPVFNEGVEDRRDRVVFHTLRHTFASWLAINGTPIYTIKELMGHKTLAMTERYSHLAPGTKRQAVENVFGVKEKEDA